MTDLYAVLNDPEMLEAWRRRAGIPMDPSRGACVLMCAGEFTPMEVDADPEEGDLLVAVDNGLSYLEMIGRLPDLLLGDFDSLADGKSETFTEFETVYPDRVLHLPVMKDDTDCMAAVRLAIGLGFKKIRLYGACGGRMDHMMANIASAVYAKKHGADCYFLNAEYMMFLIGPGDVKTFHPAASGMFSVFALSERIEGLTIRGMHYNIEDGTLTNDFPLGASNELGPQFLSGDVDAIHVEAVGENMYAHNGETAGSDTYTMGKSAGKNRPACGDKAALDGGKSTGETAVREKAASVRLKEGYALAILTYKVEEKTREY